MYRRLTYTDRLKIEAWYRAGVPVRQIAKNLDKHISSIYRELKAGFYQHTLTDLTEERRYSADRGDLAMRFKCSGKGRPLKLGNDYEFVAFVERMILQEHCSPAVILSEIRRQNLHFRTEITLRTLYSYIDKGLFLHVSNKDLIYKGKKKRKYRKVRRAAHAPVGESIERRPQKVQSREEFGHWEMDSVVGKRKKGATVVALTERKTRMEILLKSNGKDAAGTVALIDRLEKVCGKSFPWLFRTITVDNGTEFSACEDLERSCLSKGHRTKIYYCHPYCSSERGSNENQNRFVRRFIPKGTPIDQYTQEDLNDIARFMNRYPRKLFDFRSSADLFQEEIRNLNFPKIFYNFFRKIY